MGGKAKKQAPSRSRAIFDILQRTWPKATAELDFRNAYQLTVATILSGRNISLEVFANLIS